MSVGFKVLGNGGFDAVNKYHIGSREKVRKWGMINSNGHHGRLLSNAMDAG